MLRPTLDGPIMVLPLIEQMIWHELNRNLISLSRWFFGSWLKYGCSLFTISPSSERGKKS